MKKEDFIEEELEEILEDEELDEDEVDCNEDEYSLAEEERREYNKNILSQINFRR